MPQATDTLQHAPSASLIEQANAALRAKRLPEAEALFKLVLQQKPDAHEAVFGLGVTAFTAGKPEAAAPLIAQAIKMHPSCAPYYYQLGAIYNFAKNPALAAEAFKKALELSPEFAEAHLSYGAAQFQLGKHKEAFEYTKKAVELKPGYVEARVLLGRFQLAAGAIALAEEQFDVAISLEPGNLALLERIGEACYKVQAHRLVDKYFGKMLESNPESARALKCAGIAKEALGDFKEARKLLQKAIRLTPNDAALYNTLGTTLAKMGEIDRAIKNYEKAIELNPGFASSYSNLSLFKKYSEKDHEAIERIEFVLSYPRTTEEGRMYLHFALGKAYDDCKQYEKAFAHYKEGNRIARKGHVFKRGELTKLFDVMIETLDKPFFKQFSAYGSESETPVFIVGMPRSGTTLTEQILSSHPDVYGADELDEITKISILAPQILGTNVQYSKFVRELTREQSEKLAGVYLKRINGLSGGNYKRVTDKMPYNFIHLGLIATLFPKAKILHCVRSPLDTCLSIFFQKFTSANTYAYDLAECGFYYTQYQRLMEHWKSALPMPIFEVNYDEMVEDQEGLSRRMVEFIGLPWDDRCLGYHKTERAVKTASVWQARQKIYKTSKQRWRNYEPWLDELKAELGPLLAV